MSRLAPDEVLLGLLKTQPAHGYELLDAFRDPARLGRIWNMSASQLYAVLKRLQDSGAIRGQKVPQSDAPARTEYTLTDRGEARLAAWLADDHPPTSIHRIRVLFLSRLTIAARLNLPAEPIIARQLAACEAQRARLQTEAAQTTSPVERLTLQFVIGQLDAAITWLYHCRAHPLPAPD